VSAVGHEVDTTISDYVADVRAPTPSAGAELLSQDSDNKSQRLATVLARLKQSASHYQLKQERRLSLLEHRLQRLDPKRTLQQFEQRFDEMQLRLEAALSNKLHGLSRRQQQLASRLEQQSPKHKLALEANRLSYLATRLRDAMQDTLNQSEQRIKYAAHQLETVSPLATLSRGYSITTDKNGEVITSASQISLGDTITTQLSNERLMSTVTRLP